MNLGGYAADEFAEQRKNVFVVADTLVKAKARAIKAAKHWREPHRDEMYEAEQAFSLNKSGRDRQLYIHLTPNSQRRDLIFTCDYVQQFASPVDAPHPASERVSAPE